MQISIRLYRAFHKQTCSLAVATHCKLSLCLLFAGLSHIYGQDKEQPKGSIEVISSELSKIIGPQANVEVLAEGFQFTEGPLWIEKEKMLLVSDIPANT